MYWKYISILLVIFLILYQSDPSSSWLFWTKPICGVVDHRAHLVRVNSCPTFSSVAKMVHFAPRFRFTPNSKFVFKAKPTMHIKYKNYFPVFLKTIDSLRKKLWTGGIVRPSWLFSSFFPKDRAPSRELINSFGFTSIFCASPRYYGSIFFVLSDEAPFPHREWFGQSEHAVSSIIVHRCDVCTCTRVKSGGSREPEVIRPLRVSRDGAESSSRPQVAACISPTFRVLVYIRTRPPPLPPARHVRTCGMCVRTWKSRFYRWRVSPRRDSLSLYVFFLLPFFSSSSFIPYLFDVLSASLPCRGFFINIFLFFFYKK